MSFSILEKNTFDPKSLDDVVQICVGGTIFTCTRRTFVKNDSMLRILFSGCMKDIKAVSVDGMVTLDRSPIRFKVILDALRGNSKIYINNDKQESNLKEEIRWYGLENSLEIVDLRNRTRDTKAQAKTYATSTASSHSRLNLGRDSSFFFTRAFEDAIIGYWSFLMFASVLFLDLWMRNIVSTYLPAIWMQIIGNFVVALIFWIHFFRSVLWLPDDPMLNNKFLAASVFTMVVVQMIALYTHLPNLLLERLHNVSMWSWSIAIWMIFAYIGLIYYLDQMRYMLSASINPFEFLFYFTYLLTLGIQFYELYYLTKFQTCNTFIRIIAPAIFGFLNILHFAIGKRIKSPDHIGLFAILFIWSIVKVSGALFGLQIFLDAVCGFALIVIVGVNRLLKEI